MREIATISKPGMKYWAMVKLLWVLGNHWYQLGSFLSSATAVLENFYFPLKSFLNWPILLDLEAPYE